jgi:phosphoesterase RecJ-like protein
MGTIPELAAWIEARDDIAVIAHVSPDGDALGSGLALARALRQKGKRAALVSRDEVPHMYHFLPGIENVYKPDALPFEPKCLLYEDVASYDRSGERGELAHVKDTALIDHHATNPCFANLCVIDETASATGVLVLRLIDLMGVPLDYEIAVNLYTAITTDTGNLAYRSTTPEAVRGVARCLEVGFDLEDINRRLFRMRTRARTMLLGMALSAAEFLCGGRVAVTRIDKQMFETSGAVISETEGIINFLIETEGVEAAVVAEERDVFHTKFSLRSTGQIDVSEVAHHFGGGGHRQAAGADLRLPLNEAADSVVAKLCALLEA